MPAMSKTIPCVLMRAGTSRGPFFLREWLPEDDATRDQVLIGAIGASDPLQLDGVGGGSTLNSKVAIVSRSTQPDCDLDYLLAQVGALPAGSALPIRALGSAGHAAIASPNGLSSSLMDGVGSKRYWRITCTAGYYD